MLLHFQRPDIIRPPSEWKSYFLPLTSGCSNNTCIYCSWYGSKLLIRDIDEVKEEIDALALLIHRGVRLPAIPDIAYVVARRWDGKRVFLQDGDALVYPFPILAYALERLTCNFPGLERVGSYATPPDLSRMHVA